MIELAEQDGVAVLRLAHGKVNAMSIEFCEALTARFAEISSARAVVMTASGRTFSAGVDLVRLLEGGAPYVRKKIAGSEQYVRHRLLPSGAGRGRDQRPRHRRRLRARVRRRQAADGAR